ncbi:MAG: hypothetical protein JNL97_07415 [Verrucomicrobiales bacterium]|nr:hypothetical protein [Verrucomicrobiales bacterium]
MYERYRKLKHFGVPVILATGLWLMRGEPDASGRWLFGICLTGLMTVAYVAEELWWMARGEGRPCSSCGKKSKVKSFRLEGRCPHCGNPL